MHRGYNTTFLEDTEGRALVVAQKGRGARGGSTSTILAFRGTVLSNSKDISAGRARSDMADIGGVVGVLGREVGGYFTRDAGCVGSYAEIYNDTIFPGISYFMEKADDLTLTGHSMGGVMAQYASLTAYAMDESKEISVVTFGTPVTFDRSGAREYDEIILNHDRFFFPEDPIVKGSPHTGRAHRLVFDRSVLAVPKMSAVASLGVGRSALASGHAASAIGHDHFAPHFMTHYLAALSK